MAHQSSIDAVIGAIREAYADADGAEPTVSEIIARSGVSSATYHRVLGSLDPDPSNDAATILAAVKKARKDTISAFNGDDEAQPHPQVQQLRLVIARLLDVIDSKDREIERARRSRPPDNVLPLGSSSRRPRA